MNERHAYRAAQLYYLQDQTMEAIAEDLGVSRSTVSRLLAHARHSGIVRIAVQAPDAPVDRTSKALHDAFGVTAHVVPVLPAASDPQRLDAVARHAAALLDQWMSDEMTLGVAWGTTTSAIAGHLTRHPLSGCTVIQLNGAANAHTSGVSDTTHLLERFASAYEAELYYFPTPTFFDYVDTKEALWRERSVRRVLGLRRSCDAAVFSVGAFQGRLLSQVYTSGYLGVAEVRELAAQQVVGDVATYFLREDGSYADIAMNRRASGPSPAELRRIMQRMCVVAGDNKIRGTLGALRAGVVTDLVIDARTATGLLDYLHS